MAILPMTIGGSGGGTNLIYGAYWDGTSRTDWIRTDDAVNFDDPVPYYSGMSETPSSVFDNLMPWAGMAKEERTGGTMVKIPKFYYKLSQVGAGMKIQISPIPQTGFVCSPAHMDRGDGNGERDYVYIGRYKCSDTNYKSTTGVLPKGGITRTDARTSIHNLGSNIWQLDFATKFTKWLLYIVEFANWNSQNAIGYGCGDGNETGTVNTGYTDSMPYHTGTTKTSRTTYGFGTQYRYIEGLWDNVFEWCDGVFADSNGMCITLNPSNFADSAGGVSVGFPSNGRPSAFEVKNVANTFPLFIPSASGGTTSTYSCDYWGYQADKPILFTGGGYDRSLDCGLFNISLRGLNAGNAYIGCRLMELP